VDCLFQGNSVPNTSRPKDTYAGAMLFTWWGSNGNVDFDRCIFTGNSGSHLFGITYAGRPSRLSSLQPTPEKCLLHSGGCNAIICSAVEPPDLRMEKPVCHPRRMDTTVRFEMMLTSRSWGRSGRSAG